MAEQDRIATRAQARTSQTQRSRASAHVQPGTPRSVDEVAQSFFHSGWDAPQPHASSPDADGATRHRAVATSPTPSSAQANPVSAGSNEGRGVPRSQPLVQQRVFEGTQQRTSSSAHTETKAPKSTGYTSAQARSQSAEKSPQSSQASADRASNPVTPRRRRPMPARTKAPFAQRVASFFSRNHTGATPQDRAPSEQAKVSAQGNQDEHTGAQPVQNRELSHHAMQVEGDQASHAATTLPSTQPALQDNPLSGDTSSSPRTPANRSVNHRMSASAPVQPDHAAPGSSSRPEPALPADVKERIAAAHDRNSQPHPSSSNSQINHQAPLSNEDTSAQIAADEPTQPNRTHPQVRDAVTRGAQKMAAHTQRVSQGATQQVGSASKRGAALVLRGLVGCRERYRTYAKKKAAQRKPGEFHIGILGKQAILVLVFLVFCTAVLYSPCRTYYKEYRAHQRLESKYAQLNAYRNELDAEVKSLQTPEGIEDAAREELGMVREGENTARVTGTTTEEDMKTARTITGTAPVSWWTIVLDVIFGLGDTSVDQAPDENEDTSTETAPAHETDDVQTSPSHQTG